MTKPAPVVFLLDVDNTLLDNDRIVADLKRHLMQSFGAECQQRYWTIFKERRTQLGYTDYLGALQRYRDENPRDPHLLKISSYLMDYPFADRLCPGSLDVIKHLSAWGETVILSDGDVIFQPGRIYIRPSPNGVFKLQLIGRCESGGTWKTACMGHAAGYLRRQCSP
ncbi:MAG TPA: HAD family hydrolase [Acidobacteriota bacterium]|nr:HAD family hydrolase [Acidobacteriota bacterium]